MIVTVFLGEDWQGLYLDGELERQGHSLRILEVLNSLKDHSGEPIRSVEVVEEKGDWLQYEGYLPVTVKELIEKNKDDE